MGDVGGAPRDARWSGVNGGGSRYFGFGASMVRVVTTAGVCVMGLLDFEEENQENVCDAIMVKNKEYAFDDEGDSKSHQSV